MAVYKYMIILVVLTAAMISSCTKVIDVDLNDKDPQFVIEGFVTLGETTHRIRVTKTQNFDESTPPPPVDNAVVILKDDLGNMVTMVLVGPGLYEASGYPVSSGRTYTVDVTVDAQTFSASEIMPGDVPLDTLTTFPFSFGPQSVNAIIPMRTDPAGIENYYQFILTSNGKRVPGSFIQTDQYNDGNQMMEPIFSDGTNPGDTVFVEMFGISKAVYKYFYQLQANQQGATPANPTSNFSGGCLGYFSVRTKDTMTVIIP